MSLTPGRRLGRFEIVESLGAGGMGEVYRARDTRLTRDVALKVLPETVAADAHRLERFERETRVLAALNHPNIVTIYSVEDIEGVRFFTMELVEGAALSASSGPADRYQTMREVERELRDLKKETDSEPSRRLSTGAGAVQRQSSGSRCAR